MVELILSSFIWSVVISGVALATLFALEGFNKKTFIYASLCIVFMATAVTLIRWVS
jgi:hypothetical protein